jgi:hypothetical protein
LVGICSYLLVNFWFTRIAANQSSLSALLTNRVGDTVLTVGMFAIIWSFGNLDYSTVFALAPYYNENIITIIGICLLIGATAKSSQVGRRKKKAPKNDKSFFWTLIYAGIASNALESAGPLSSCKNDPEKSQGQGANQQGINELTDSKKFEGKFLEWFIGFTEGDGSFIITGGKSVFTIHLHVVDLPLLYKIQTGLNMGNVYFKDNSATLIIKANKDIATLIEIFNGNLFLDKRKIQFAKWVDNYNLKNKTDIKIKQNKFYPTLNHGWLSGFVDAEGSFFVSVSKNRVVQRFSITQKDAEPEFLYLKELLKGNYELRNGNSRVVVNFYALDTIIEYLTGYKLHSVKAESLEKWLEISDYRKNKSSIEKVDYVQLKKKASLINQLRKIPKI